MTSQPFAITPNAYIRRVLIAWLVRYGWLLALPSLALIAAGFFDGRYFIVAAMWIFIIIPGVMFFVYLNYGLSENARNEIMPHIVDIDEDKIKVTFIDKDGGKSKCKPLTIRLSEDARMEQLSNSYTIYPEKSPYVHINLPLDAFAPEDQERLHRMFAKYSRVE